MSNPKEYFHKDAEYTYVRSYIREKHAKPIEMTKTPEHHTFDSKIFSFWDVLGNRPYIYLLVLLAIFLLAMSILGMLGIWGKILFIPLSGFRNTPWLGTSFIIAGLISAGIAVISYKTCWMKRGYD